VDPSIPDTTPEWKKQVIWTDSLNQTYKYTGNYEPFSQSLINTSYSYSLGKKRGYMTGYNSYSVSGGGSLASPSEEYVPQSLAQDATVNMNYGAIPGFVPQTKYGGNNSLDYNRDELDTRTDFGAGCQIVPSDWWDALKPSAPSFNYMRTYGTNAQYQAYYNPNVQKGILVPSQQQLSFWDKWWIVPNESVASNSVQQVTDNAYGRFNVLSDLTISPRGSYSSQRNQQAKFITKTKVFSVGSSAILNNPPVFQSWLKPTSLDLRYDYKKQTNYDDQDNITSTSTTHTGGLTFPFRPSDVFSGSLLANGSYGITEDRSIKTIMRSVVPGMELFENLAFDSPIKLPNFWPFGGAEINLQHALRVREGFSATFTRNTTYMTTGNVDISNDMYSGTLGADYTASKNITINILGQIQYYKDHILIGKDYWAWDISIRANAVF